MIAELELDNDGGGEQSQLKEEVRRRLEIIADVSTILFDYHTGLLPNPEVLRQSISSDVIAFAGDFMRAVIKELQECSDLSRLNHEIKPWIKPTAQEFLVEKLTQVMSGVQGINRGEITFRPTRIKGIYLKEEPASDPKYQPIRSLVGKDLIPEEIRPPG